MLDSFRAAPKSIRRVAAISLVFLFLQFIAFMFYGYAMYTELSKALEVYDPFNPSSLSFKPTGVNLLFAGFATSTASGFAGFAALLSLRTVVPYRGRSRAYALLLTFAQIAFILIALFGVVFGGRDIDLRLIGSMLSLVIALPILLYLNSKSAKIWCKPLPPAPPPLPPGS